MEPVDTFGNVCIKELQKHAASATGDSAKRPILNLSQLFANHAQ